MEEWFKESKWTLHDHTKGYVFEITLVADDEYHTWKVYRMESYGTKLVKQDKADSFEWAEIVCQQCKKADIILRTNYDDKP